MTTVEIILLVAGILCLIASFMIPGEKKKESKEESSVNRQPIQELTQAEQDKVRERINDIINEQLGEDVNARVRVSGNIYVGVKLIFGEQNYFIKEKRTFCQFVKDKADIKWQSL